jgi:hypothetical protein
MILFSINLDHILIICSFVKMNFNDFVNFINSLARFEDIFTWYCCLFGLIGNTITCVLFAVKILKLHNNYYKFNSNTSSSLLTTTSTSNENNTTNTTIVFNRNIILEKKHNITIYLYYIGILVSDLILLFNWILSKISINTSAEIKLTNDEQIILDSTDFIKDNFSNTDLNLARYDDYMEFLRTYSIHPDKNITNYYYTIENFIYMNKSISNNDLNVSPSLWNYYYIALDSIIDNLNIRIFNIKFIDLQGVCQLYYYFTIISLNGSFIYILASLLDRIVKIRVINKEILTTNGDDYFKLDVKKLNAPQEIKKIINNSTTNNEVLSLKKSRKYVKYASSQIRNLSSKHSDIVKQLFGKTSSIFICLFIIFFYFHLLWIYGSVKEEEWLGHYQFDLIKFNQSTNLTYNVKSKLYYVKSTKLVCQLLNLSNHLPLFVMGLDLFLLLILGVLKIFFIVFLMKLDINKNITQPMRIPKKNLDKKRNKYFLKSCTIHISLFNTIFTMPSVIARNVLMIFILASSLNVQSSTNNDLSYMNLDDKINSSTFYDNKTLISLENTQVSINNNPVDWSLYLNNLCNKFDFFLLIASSHKFLIFVFKCYLYKHESYYPKK